VYNAKTGQFEQTALKKVKYTTKAIKIEQIKAPNSQHNQRAAQLNVLPLIFV
jgi:hypothetical protein